MFTGTYQNSIDGKNRMIIPSKYRDELGHRCVLTKGLDGRCLYIFSLQDWEGFMKKLSELPALDINSRQLMRHFYAGASECDIDKQGRIIISQDLREYAGIEKDLVTIGFQDKIEVWSKAEWENIEKIEPSEIAQKLAAYGISI